MATQHSNIDWDHCTLQTCPLSLANVKYIPSLAGNALYLAIFALIMVIQSFLGIRYRTWGFLGSLLGGLALEIIGYVGRVQMHFNDWLGGPYLM